MQIRQFILGVLFVSSAVSTGVTEVPSTSHSVIDPQATIGQRAAGELPDLLLQGVQNPGPAARPQFPKIGEQGGWDRLANPVLQHQFAERYGQMPLQDRREMAGSIPFAEAPDDQFPPGPAGHLDLKQIRQ